MQHHPSRLGRLLCGVVWVVGSGLLTASSQPSPQQAAAPGGADDVQAALRHGAYERAELGSRELLLHLGTPSESEDLAGALDLLVASLVGNGKTGEAQTLALAVRAVELRERLYGAGDLRIAASLDNLGDVHVGRGEYRHAIGVFDRARTLREQQLPPTHTDIALAAERLALPLIRLESFDRADALLKRAVAIREAEGDPMRLARCLELLALLGRYQGDLAAASTRVSRALALRRGAGEEVPGIAALLYLSGDLSYLSGDVAAARRTYDEALAVAERVLRPGHPEILSIRRRIAITMWAIGNLTEARQLRQELRLATDAGLPPCHPDRASVRGDLANSLAYDGEYTQARQLYESVLETFEQCLGPTHSLTATVLHNLANLMREIGDFAEAERLHRQVVSTWSARLGPNHRYVAIGLDGIAEIRMAQQRYRDARTMYARALAIRKAVYGPRDANVGWALGNLARVDAALGNTASALQQIAEAAAIYASSPPSDDPDRTARLFELRGSIELRAGQTGRARESYGLAFTARTRVLGPAHPLTARSQSLAAALDLMVGAPEAALAGALHAEQLSRDHLRATMRYLPERQALAYAEARAKGLDVALSAIAGVRALDPAPVYDALIRSRGVVLDELIERVHSTAGADGDPWLAAVREARQRFADLSLRSLREPVAPGVLDDARRQKESAERALADRSAAARAELARGQAGLMDVARALPAGWALVSYARFERADARVIAGQTATSPAYGAFVVHSGEPGRVIFVPLGAASTIDAIIRSWRAEAMRADGPGRGGERTYQAAGARLRTAVWDPIAPHLSSATQAFIVPDGLLNLVNLAALPIGNQYLIETGLTLHHLSAERDLLMEDPVVQSRSALFIGGPAFERTGLPRAAVRSQRSGCESLGRGQFPPLPGSLREAREISSLWASAASGDAILLSGAAASETTVKASLGGRRVVHLATHGYVLNSAGCGPAVAGTRAVGAVVPADASASRAILQNPLLLSGLAFAGANSGRSATDADDGILTAEEIAGLNLQGTEWAVLSACDTGLGEIRAGEGVFGLRRAFQIAGARTIIMSLWSVDDQATRQWMVALYQARLQRHLSTADAMREASRTILAARRAAGQSTHPFYWAAFVAAGDWR